MLCYFVSPPPFSSTFPSTSSTTGVEVLYLDPMVATSYQLWVRNTGLDQPIMSSGLRANLYTSAGLIKQVDRGGNSCSLSLSFSRSLSRTHTHTLILTSLNSLPRQRTNLLPPHHDPAPINHPTAHYLSKVLPPSPCGNATHLANVAVGDDYVDDYEQSALSLVRRLAAQAPRCFSGAGKRLLLYYWLS